VLNLLFLIRDSENIDETAHAFAAQAEEIQRAAQIASNPLKFVAMSQMQRRTHHHLFKEPFPAPGCIPDNS